MKKLLASLFSSLSDILDGLGNDPAILSLMPREMFSETSPSKMNSVEIDRFPQQSNYDK